MPRTAGGLAYSVDGPDGAPVLVLGPALGTTTALWRRQVVGAAALTDRFRVVRHDHLGHGASAVPSGPYTIAQLGGLVADLVDEVCEALHVPRVVLGGVSLGGMTTQWVAAHRPGRLAGAALLCTGAHLPPAGGWADRAALVRREGTERVADQVVGRWFTPGYAQGHPDTVAWARAMVASTSSEGYAACAEAVGAMDLRADLAAVTVPVLVVAAEHDPSTPPERSQEIVAALGAGTAPVRYETVPDAAHLALVEQDAAVSGLLAGFAGPLLAG